MNKTASSDVERLVSEVAPDAEVLLTELLNGEKLRVFLDREGGVDLGLCESVTKHLRDSFEDFSIEVSSPGADRPLSKPKHFRQFQGSKARVKTTVSIAGKKSFTGQIVGCTDEDVTVAADSGVITVPFSSIKRSNLVVE